MEILAPGRKLDRLIAERLFNKKIYEGRGHVGRKDVYVLVEDGVRENIFPVFEFSTKGPAALMVIERLIEMKYLVVISGAENQWTCSLTYMGDEKRKPMPIPGVSDTFPHAVALAALNI